MCFSVVFKCCFCHNADIQFTIIDEGKKTENTFKYLFLKNVLEPIDQLSDLLIDCIADDQSIHRCSVVFIISGFWV